MTASIRECCEQHLVPLILEPYAAELAQRVQGRHLDRVLEIDGGCGLVTRHLAQCVPAACELVATQTDGRQLPFANASFDAVLCQFGAMFFADKTQAFAEVRRVLRPGGVFLFDVWDRLEHNEFADVVTRSMADLFPQDPPRFLARTLYGFHNIDTLMGHLGRAGFVRVPDVETVTARSRAASAEIPAVAYCQGTELRTEIEERGPRRLAEATQAATEMLARRFGRGKVDGKIQAHVFTVYR